MKAKFLILDDIMMKNEQSFFKDLELPLKFSKEKGFLERIGNTK